MEKNCKTAIRKFFALHANSKNTPFIYDIVLHCSHFTILELMYHFQMTIKMQWRIHKIYIKCSKVYRHIELQFLLCLKEAGINKKDQ